MKCKLITYVHSGNGLALFVIPESDVERELLEGLWKHGQLNTSNGIADNSSRGFSVRWRLHEAIAQPGGREGVR